MCSLWFSAGRLNPLMFWMPWVVTLWWALVGVRWWESCLVFMRILMRSGSQTKPGSFLITQSLLHRHRCVYDVCIIAEFFLASILTGLHMMDSRGRGLLSQWWKMSLGSWFPQPGKMCWLELLEQYVTYDDITFCNSVQPWLSEIASVLFPSCKELKEMMLLLLSEAWWMQRLSFPWKTCWTVWIVTTCALRRCSQRLELGKTIERD